MLQIIGMLIGALVFAAKDRPENLQQDVNVNRVNEKRWRPARYGYLKRLCSSHANFINDQGGGKAE